MYLLKFKNKIMVQNKQKHTYFNYNNVTQLILQ